ncbi:hypothetical protein AB0K89_05250 [Streptomyces cinnamoneus]|uniref:hypothetical protein n=1 Tax=Streptomyces cinnamoneus TaxID=53446 RepID=UPI00342F9917
MKGFAGTGTRAGPSLPASGELSQPERDHLWWVPPAICTPLALLLAYADFADSGIPLVWALGYLLPFTCVAGAWAGARVRHKRVQRIVLGIAGCTFAYLYTQCLMAVLMPIRFLVWIFYGDG